MMPVSVRNSIWALIYVAMNVIAERKASRIFVSDSPDFSTKVCNIRASTTKKITRQPQRTPAIAFRVREDLF